MSASRATVRVELELSGMLAVHAVRAMQTALAGVPGIIAAEVTLGRATVDHDGSVPRTALESAAELAGCAIVGYREERRLPVV